MNQQVHFCHSADNVRNAYAVSGQGPVRRRPAQVGSINVGAIDPLEAIADIRERHGLWFHADRACGAVGAMLPEKRAL